VSLRRGPAVLEVEPADLRPLDRAIGAWLRAAADLADILLEAERSGRAGPARGLLREAPGLVGTSAAMALLRDRIHRAARSDAPVLIEGESGVGKELVARQVHALSRRARGPFVAVNCAALVETLFEAELFGIEDRTATGVRGRRGKFEQAEGGTLFLDEIGDLAVAAQAKLLRVLQDLAIERVGGHGPIRVNVRVLAATNRSLATLAGDGRFRTDLFWRLNCLDVRVPPLRARREDLPELTREFLARYGEGRVTDVAPEAADALADYDWPGNVRELERVVQRAAALGSSHRVELEDLPPQLTAPVREVFGESLERRESLRRFTARYVRLVLHRCGYNKREACRRLDISYHTLQTCLRHVQDLESREQPALPAGGEAACAAPGPLRLGATVP
jgi:DNA-binding NtrC family response regulator